MGKKDNLKEYFQNFKQPELPTTSKKGMSTMVGNPSEKPKEFTTHKIFDDPINTPALDLTKEAVQGLILSIDPNDVVLWQYKDRPENELGDLEEFAKILKTVGQLQAGIVRYASTDSKKYELLVGERRWRACKIAGILFQAKLVNYTDAEAGLAQAIENKEREKLSDYARGMNFAKQIEANILKQSDLIEKLGESKQQVSRLLSFREIPNELISAIGDMTKVSARTAECIKQLCKKNPANFPLLLNMANKISTGIGFKTIEKHVTDAKINGQNVSTEKVLSLKDQRHLFTVRKDGNGNTSVSFPKEIRNFLNIKKVQNVIREEIEQQINMRRESPRGDS